MILEYFHEKPTGKFSLKKCRMIRKEGRRCIRMQAIIAIFILGGIIIPFAMKVINKTEKAIDKAPPFSHVLGTVPDTAQSDDTDKVFLFLYHVAAHGGSFADETTDSPVQLYHESPCHL